MALGAPRRTAFSEIEKLGILLIWISAGVGAYFVLPLGVAALIAIAGTFKIWPQPGLGSPKEIQIYNLMSEGMRRKSEVIGAMGKNMTAPTSATLGFGDPGDPGGMGEEGDKPDGWPPTRLSSWWAILFASAAAIAIFITHPPFPTHWNSVLYNTIGTFLGVFIIIQGFAAGWRETRDDVDEAPAAQANMEISIETWESNKGGIIALGLLGAGIGGFIPFFLKWPLWTIPLGIALGTLIGAFSVYSRVVTKTQIAEWKDYIDRRDTWSRRWESIPKLNMPAPIFGDSVGSPTSGPTHELASFACPEGVVWTDYALHIQSLISQIGKSMLTISPMPMRDENNQNIPGSENPAEFYLAYPLGNLDPSMHLDPQTDANTRKFLVMWHVQDALRAAKIPHITLLALRPLCLPDSPAQLYETKWRLPRTVPYQKFLETSTLLTRALGASWLRIGTTELSVEGRPLPTDEVTIVFGDPPTHAQLADRSGVVKHQIDSLAWDGWWKACKVVTREGITPRMIKSEINKRGILEAQFALPEGISIEQTVQAIPALTSATGYAYIEIEAGEQPSYIYLAAGEKDPLNELYLFSDWEQTILKQPQKGESHLMWVAGIGVDGEPLVYDFAAELPHLHIAGSSGSGKMLFPSTSIPLASGGFTTMGDIKIGDRIFDENGNPCNVTHVYDFEIPQTAYRMVFDDGTEVLAGGTHKWRTHDYAYRQARQALKKRTDADGVLLGRRDVVEAAKRVRVLADRCREISPHKSPHENSTVGGSTKKELGVSSSLVAESVPAFVLGAWVGSGMSASGRVCSREDLASSIEGLGWECTPVRQKGSVKRYWTVRRLIGVLEAGGLLDAAELERFVGGFDGVRLGQFLSGVVTSAGELVSRDDGVNVVSVSRRAAGVVRAALVGGDVEWFDPDVVEGRKRLGRRPRVRFGFDGGVLAGSKVEHWAEFSPPPFITGFWLASGCPKECLVTVGEQEVLDALVREGFIPSRLSEERANPRWIVRGLKRELERFGLLDGGVLDERWLNVSLNDRKAFIAGVCAGRVDSSGVVSAVFENVETAKVVGLMVEDVLGSSADMEEIREGKDSGSVWRVVFTVARPESSGVDDGWLLDYAPMEQIAGDAGGYLPLLWKLAARHGVSPVPARRAAEQRYSNRVATKEIRTFLYPRGVMLDLLADHLYDLALGSSEQAPRVVNTDEIFNSMTGSNGGSNHALPLTGAVQYDEDPELLVPPYVLGAWLGDGTSAEGKICGIDHEIFDRCGQYYEKRFMTVSNSADRHEDFRLMKFEGLREHLKELGLSKNKHIPEQYMRASVEDRMALLQGLIDTYGSVTKTGNVEFYASDEALAKQVHTLVASLGLKPSLRMRKTSHKDAYTVSFTTSQHVTSLVRKAERQKDDEDLRETNMYRYVVKCEPIDPVPMRCIEVDSPSHEYLCTESFIPTHNSALTNSMIVQLCYANDPEDLSIRMIEPKNELQAYTGLQHVTHFVDMFTPADSIFQSAADLLEDTAIEMERRYSLFNQHPLGPQKLSEARQIAREEPIPPGEERHPLDLPYILVIVEECSDIYRKPVMKQQIPEWERVIYNSEWLARKARAAGIFLITITQRPTKDSIPITVKDQSRRIGLAVETNMQSMIIIDQPGLESIPSQSKGRGLMSYGKGYKGFRSLYMRRPDESNPNEPDDRARLLASMPQRAVPLGGGGAVSSMGNVQGPTSGGGSGDVGAPAVPKGIWDE